MWPRVVIVATFGLSALYCGFGARRALKHDGNATDWAFGCILCVFFAAWGAFG